jgi:hypothetical protein
VERTAAIDCLVVCLTPDAVCRKLQCCNQPIIYTMMQHSTVQCIEHTCSSSSEISSFTPTVLRHHHFAPTCWQAVASWMHHTHAMLQSNMHTSHNKKHMYKLLQIWMRRRSEKHPSANGCQIADVGKKWLVQAILTVCNTQELFAVKAIVATRGSSSRRVSRGS